MLDENQLVGEAKVMEPIYRMVKLIAQEDKEQAKMAMALAVQYISEHYLGKVLTQKDVQDILRAVLLFHNEGKYYASYLLNELQVKVAGWLTLMAIDRPITLGELSELVEALAQGLRGKNILLLSAQEVLNAIKEQLKAIDEVVYERILLNEACFKEELEIILFK